MIKYKIEGQYLDQFQDEQFAVTKAISKIGEIDLRHGDFSTTFKVPLTAKNVEILRYTPELNNRSNLDNFKRYNGQLVEDDAVISDGYYQVTGFNPTKKEASIKFLGGNSDWFDLLKDRYINDSILNSEFNYDLFDSNHLFKSSEIVSSWDGSKPYYYFLSDNGENSDRILPKTQDTDWHLSYYQSYIFSKIFNSVNIKTQGTLFNDPTFYDEVIATDKNSLKSLGAQNRVTNYQIGANLSTVSHESVTPRDEVYFNTLGENEQFNGNTFTASNVITQLNLKIRIQTTVIPGATGMDVYYSRNGGAYALTPMTNEIITGSTGYSFYVSLPFYNLAVNETIKIQFAYKAPSPTIGTNFIKGKQFSTLEIEEIGIEPQVTASEMMPKIKQTDFIKDVMFRYGVVSQYDVKTRTLTLDKFEGIDNNRVNAPDWTNKIDLSKDVDVDYTKILSNYGKKSLIEYANDTDKDVKLKLFKALFKEGLGNGIIAIDNDFLSDEKTIYKSPFAATLSELTFENNTYYLPYIPTFTPSNEPNEIKPRILIAKKTKVEAFNNQGDTSLEVGNIPYNEVGYAFFCKVFINGVTSQDLNEDKYGVIYSNIAEQMNVNSTLLERNYQLYQKILNDPFYVSLHMNLTALDVQQVDFLTPIYLDYQYDSGYYYIDSIEQYKGDGTTTKVNLVKI